MESDLERKAERLAALRREWDGCTRCPLGERENRPDIVFGSGNPDAEILIVATVPSLDDVAAGEPFQGPPDHLEVLSSLFNTYDLDPQEVYVCYVLMCRPEPQHNKPYKCRNPKPAEMKRCQPALEGIIEIVDPKVLMLLGNTPYKRLKIKQEERTFIRAARDKRSSRLVVETQGQMVKVKRSAFVTFDPEYLLEHWTLEEGGPVFVASRTFGDMLNYLDTYNYIYFGTPKPDRGQT